MIFLKLLAALTVALCLLLFILCYFEIGAEIADGINREALLELRPGMTEQEVLQLIGPPLDKRHRYPSHPTGEAPQRDGYTSWIYGKPGYCEGGLEIAVGIQSGRVVAVGVELYDLGVYRCNQDQCPVVWDAAALNRLPPRKRPSD